MANKQSVVKSILDILSLSENINYIIDNIQHYNDNNLVFSS